jgi:hypothetical protein
MDLRSALNQLLSAPDFQALEARLRNVSAFHILGIARRELSHAGFLRWLLDPRASHGAGSEPLRRFMLLAADLGEGTGLLDVADVDELDLDSMSVTTEFAIEVGDRTRRPDLVVVTDSEQPVLVVEYKVDAEEGEDQTAAYVKWAKTQRLDRSGGRTPLPLLVYICPHRKKGKKPSPPFVHITYEPYLGWLEAVGVVVRAKQAVFLLEEFRTCLAQRDDVEDKGRQELVDNLEANRAESIRVLRDANGEQLAPFKTVVARHSEALAYLGIETKRRLTLGPSPFLARLREVLGHTLSEGLWTYGGVEGSIFAIFRPFQEATSLKGLGNLRVHFVVTRPDNGSARVALEISAGISGLNKVAARKARLRIAESAREALTKTHANLHSSGQSVIRFNVLLPGINDLEDDTEERVGAFEKEIEQAAETVKSVEKPLKRWVEKVVPGLLP